MAASEAAPFAQTGGLGDVVGSLPRALQRLGVDVSVVIPAYRCAHTSGHPLRDTGWTLEVPLSRETVPATVLRTTVDDLPFYLIRADQYFDREGLYGTADGDYLDNAARFTFFARAVAALLPRLGPTNILHCHDWEAALVPLFLRADADRYPGTKATRTVLTIHNIGYQGLFWHLDWHLLNLDWQYFNPECLEFYGKINFLKGGIVSADAITTVSPTHALEICNAQFGYGLEGLLAARKDRLVGILNGADYDEWNPARDPDIAMPYGPEDAHGKALCKADLQQTVGLPAAERTPLLGMVSRLVAQKGIELLAEAAPRLLRRKVQFVVLGAGERPYQELLQTLANRHPKKFAFRTAFDRRLAHKITAGCDVFLMPSRYEPCGLSQLHSLRYGSVPLVRATGGLQDSVVDEAERRAPATGFKFVDYSPQAFLECLDRCLRAYRRPTHWAALVGNAMRADFSWKRSAMLYVDLYRRLLR